MKKLLFISMIGLFAVSCQPAELTCDCSGTGGGSVTLTGGLSLIDTNLIGHWKNTSPLVNLGSYTFSSNWTPVTDIDVYFSPDGIVHFSHTYNATTSTGDSYNYFKDNQMHFNVIDDGILCINNSIIIHYQINNGVFTYYNEQNIDYSFFTEYGSTSGEITFGAELTNLNDSYYYVSSNSLTKQ